MSFEEFETQVRKHFRFLIPAGHRHVWMDPNRRGGMRYCAATTNGMFITGNPMSRTIAIYKDKKDRTPTTVML